VFFKKAKTITKRTKRKLRSEPLETRRVMAASVDLTPEGYLIIEGDATDNRIWVDQRAAGDRLRVSVDGRHRDFAVSEINAILIQGHAGNDSIGIGRNVEIPAQIYGGDGDDLLRGGGGPTLVNGGNGNDVIRGGRATNILFGGAGNDRIYGGPGVDYLVGGSGDDWLHGGDGDDFIFGDGTDELPAGVSDVFAYARQYADFNTGNDVIFGGLGTDVIFGGPGSDQINTQDGDVDVVYADASDRLVADRIDRIIRVPVREGSVEVDQRDRLNYPADELRLLF
jgi:Ca2+-binding RTX toxin-like protein